MYPKMKKDNIPDEIQLFKKISTEITDPIKKEVYSFSELAYIINNSKAFPIKASEYYTIKYEIGELDQLLSLLSLSYIAYRTYNKDKSTKVYITKEDLLYIMKFIRKFYQYDEPRSDSENSNILWIYPKLKIKKFLSDCIIRKGYDNFYYDEETLTKLVLIISGFVKYEYDNADDEIIDKIESLNYPTLILANIGLYEKGYLKLNSNYSNIEVSLDITGKNNNGPIFSKDQIYLKKRILNIIREVEGKEYKLSDFME